MCFFLLWLSDDNIQYHVLYHSSHIINDIIPDDKINDECPICLELLSKKISENNNYTHMACCKQIIHTKCLIEVYDAGHDECPICRADLF